uniref:Protein kinase domain-containing protein n=1 Tax=Chromera velia CCMP2878 TaxID=1169474 RepID=A0A0G4H9T3_9ALVE|eukprot:Cvel_6036.t1-p1 / transcript=Cvel_6036.t1 / gene=Cvel_6036 / organism=Chromera_velia_CCMP2878 / gene_product=hypothetical protein / transcript_product=hypothetical protein / location=Cvel_scaffold289:96887-100434(-) / protein_length=635 / sequence_SO=supercontig / SO=protein_coding / is_pseudo=false
MPTLSAFVCLSLGVVFSTATHNRYSSLSNGLWPSPVQPMHARMPEAFMQKSSDDAEELQVGFVAFNPSTLQAGQDLTINCDSGLTDNNLCKVNNLGVNSVTVKVGNQLGEGAEGFVFDCTLKTDVGQTYGGTTWVLKIPNSGKNNLNNIAVKGPAKEANILFTLNNLGVTGVPQGLIFDNKNHGAMLVEKLTMAKGGNELKIGGSYVGTGEVMQKWILSCFDALFSMHNEGYAHNDVRYDNIAMRDDGTCVLIDMGRAHRVSADDFVAAKGHGNLPNGALYFNSEYTMCPEFKTPVAGKPTSLFFRNDVYALLEESEAWDARIGAERKFGKRCNNPFVYQYSALTNMWKCADGNHNLMNKQGAQNRMDSYHYMAGYDRVLSDTKKDITCDCASCAQLIWAKGLAESVEDRGTYVTALATRRAIAECDPDDFLTDPPQNPRAEVLSNQEPAAKQAFDLKGFQTQLEVYDILNVDNLWLNHEDDPIDEDEGDTPDDRIFGKKKQLQSSQSQQNNQLLSDDTHTGDDIQINGTVDPPEAAVNCATMCSRLLDTWKNGGTARAFCATFQTLANRIQCQRTKTGMRRHTYRWDADTSTIRTDMAFGCTRKNSKKRATGWANDATKYNALETKVCADACPN